VKGGIALPHIVARKARDIPCQGVLLLVSRRGGMDGYDGSVAGGMRRKGCSAVSRRPVGVERQAPIVAPAMPGLLTQHIALEMQLVGGKRAGGIGKGCLEVLDSLHGGNG
jgi:hypothetical protein